MPTQIVIEITPDNALDYLRSTGRLGAGPARVEALGWGVSNVVLRVETPERRFVLKQSRPQLLADSHDGKFVLIQGEEVAGVFVTREEAIAAGYERYGKEPFLAKHVAAAEKPVFFSRNVGQP